MNTPTRNTPQIPIDIWWESKLIAFQRFSFLEQHQLLIDACVFHQHGLVDLTKNLGNYLIPPKHDVKLNEGLFNFFDLVQYKLKQTSGQANTYLHTLPDGAVEFYLQYIPKGYFLKGLHDQIESHKMSAPKDVPHFLRNLVKIEGQACINIHEKIALLNCTQRTFEKNGDNDNFFENDTLNLQKQQEKTLLINTIEEILPFQSYPKTDLLHLTNLKNAEEYFFSSPENKNSLAEYIVSSAIPYSKKEITPAQMVFFESNLIHYFKSEYQSISLNGQAKKEPNQADFEAKEKYDTHLNTFLDTYLNPEAKHSKIMLKRLLTHKQRAQWIGLLEQPAVRQRFEKIDSREVFNTTTPDPRVHFFHDPSVNFFPDLLLHPTVLDMVPPDQKGHITELMFSFLDEDIQKAFETDNLKCKTIKRKAFFLTDPDAQKKYLSVLKNILDNPPQNLQNPQSIIKGVLTHLDLSYRLHHQENLSPLKGSVVSSFDVSKKNHETFISALKETITPFLESMDSNNIDSGIAKVVSFYKGKTKPGRTPGFKNNPELEWLGWLSTLKTRKDIPHAAIHGLLKEIKSDKPELPIQEDFDLMVKNYPKTLKQIYFLSQHNRQGFFAKHWEKMYLLNTRLQDQSLSSPPTKKNRL